MAVAPGRRLWNNRDWKTRANTESLETKSETLLNNPLEVTNVCMQWTVAVKTVQTDRCQFAVRNHSLCG